MPSLLDPLHPLFLHYLPSIGSPAVSLMAAALGKPPDLPPEFRAPPPSPVAGVLGSGPEDDGGFSGYLNRSLRVPDLVLPDRIFHRVAWNLPEVDIPSLISPDVDGSAVKSLKSAAASLGCFQLVNHGIPSDLIAAAGSAAGEAFRIPLGKKKEALRSPERNWGFELDEEHEEQGRGEEFFWWYRRSGEELAGIWPRGYKDFSDKMEHLWVEVEKIASKIEQILLECDGVGVDLSSAAVERNGVEDNSFLCLHRHGRSSTDGDGPAGSLKHDVLRMLIKSSGCNHALSFHICRSASRFHVYSKRGCVPFPVKEGTLVATVGGKTQAWSGGRYKHVIGKPVFHGGDRHDQDAISIAFLYSGESSSAARTTANGERTVSLARQVMIAACLILLSHFILHMYAGI